MSPNDLIKKLVTGGNVSIFIGISLIISSVSAAYTSRNNLELANTLDIFSTRIQAEEAFTAETREIQKNGEKRLTVLEVTLENLTDDIDEMSADIKTLLRR